MTPRPDPAPDAALDQGRDRAGRANRRALALVALALGLGAACSQSTSSPPPTDPVLATTTSTTVPSTTTSTTEPVTTDPVTTDPVTTDPGTTDPGTTDVTTTSEPVSTTEPPVIRELLLREDGIGAVTFGAEPGGVIDYLVSFLGSPTSDSGWVAADEFALCPGDEVRRVEWGVLRVGFGDVSPFATDRPHVYQWQYGLDGQIGAEPQGLRTDGGVGLGTSVADLVAAFPDVELYEGIDEFVPPTFVVADELFGFLTGLGDDDVITEMFGGWFCGE